MKLSVIIPCYNAEKYIGNCIYKILNEQIDNVNLKSDEIEIIVINDGSTDNSQKIIEDIAIKHPNVKLINKINEGVSTARNIGIKKAIGKWIAFIDADDYLDPKSLIKLVHISDTTDGDVIAFQYRYVNSNYKSISQDNSINISGPYDGPSFIVKTEGLNWRHSSCINMYNRNFIVSNNLFFNNNIYCSEDSIFVWNVFLKAHKVFFVNNVFYNYVNNANSCMNNKSRAHLINIINKSTFPLIKEYISFYNINKPKINEYINRNLNVIIVRHIRNYFSSGQSINNILHDIKIFKSMNLWPISNYTKYPGYKSTGIKVFRIFINNKITLYLSYFYYKIKRFLN